MERNIVIYLATRKNRELEAMHIYTYLSLGRRRGKLSTPSTYMPQVDWRQNALMLDECGEAWFNLNFLFARSSIDSSFLEYIYTEVGERGGAGGGKEKLG